MRSSDMSGWLCVLLLTMVGIAIAAPAVLPAVAQSEMRERAARLQAMTPDQRSSFLLRLAAWNALPPSEREDRRARYQAWSALDSNERSALRAIATEVATFPVERQQALRAEFATLDLTQRHGWRLGQALGADYAKLHPLLAYVPADQRQPLLVMLRGMDAQQRADLAVIAQRTPPQDRQALRAELLAVSAARRSAWLQEQLDR